MPQVFQVLRCYKCLAFQVHQVKKSNKWECKLCGEKQSVKRHYGIGSGQECRFHVQKLNKLRGEKTEQNINYEVSDEDFENSGSSNNIEITTKDESIWSHYIDQKEEINTSSLEKENETLLDEEVVLELPKKHKKIHKNKRIKNIAHKNEHKEVADEVDRTNQSFVIPVSEITTKDKEIKRFVPPTNKTISKWAEYNEPENVNNQTDTFSFGFVSKNNKSYSSLQANMKNDSLKLDTSILNVMNHRINDTNKDKEPNFHNTCNSVTLKETSKWTEFINNTYDKHEQPECRTSQDLEYIPPCTKNPSNLFSLCDDKDLDSVLDI